MTDGHTPVRIAAMARTLVSAFIILTACAAQTRAQSGFEDAKLQLIKRAVWFYAQDTATFGKGKSTCADAASYNALLACVRSSGLTRVDVRVARWWKTPVNNPADLEVLALRIQTETVEGRTQRKAMPAYATLRADHQTIISAQKIDTTASTTDTAAQQTASAPSTSVQPARDTAARAVPAAPVRTDNSARGFDPWMLLPIVLALGACVVAGVFALSTRRRIAQLREELAAASSTPQALAKPIVQADARVPGLDKRIKAVEEEVASLREALKTSVRGAEVTLAEHPPTPPKPLPAEAFSPVAPVAAAVPARAQSEPAWSTSGPPAPQTRWARWADAGAGFRATSLADHQDGEQLFEISVLDGHHAKYRVVDDRRMQAAALADPSRYLAPACSYEESLLLGPQSTIETVSAGRLRLEGGVWMITSPATLRFV